MPGMDLVDSRTVPETWHDSFGMGLDRHVACQDRAKRGLLAGQQYSLAAVDKLHRGDTKKRMDRRELSKNLGWLTHS